jgi:hypothetical protein
MAGTGEIFFQQTITTIQRNTRDKWGDLTAGALYTNVPTRFVYDTSRIRGVAEDERVDALAYISPSYTVQPDDIVRFNSVNYMIVKVFHEYDLFGNVDHLKLTLRQRT